MSLRPRSIAVASPCEHDDLFRDLAQRVAVLENSMERIEEAHKDLVKDLKSQHIQILSKIDLIREELTRYKGFLGGMVFLATAIGAALASLKGWFVTTLVR